MNTFGSWWDSTVTLYNKVESASGKITWYRHVLTECFYKHTVDKVTLDKTTISTDASICRIKVRDNFVNKRQYDVLDDSEKTTHFTLAVGDIIVPEETDFEIDEYTAGKRSSDLLKEFKAYPGCFTIEVVNINTGGGRGNEHYKAKGV